MREVLLRLLLFALILSPLSGQEVLLVPLKIDGPVHDPANHTFWYGPFSECASVLDADGDGDLDIACGRNLYEAPNWVKHADFRDGAEANGPEVDNNSELSMDVDKDGRMDIVSSGWMRMRGVFWYRNPGKKRAKWGASRIHAAECVEGVIHGDIDGDGDEDLLVNHWWLQPGQGMTWLEHLDQDPWFKEHIIGPHGEKHGNGLGDINGDGRTDIVTTEGWYEGPPNPASDEWAFHGDYVFKGAASHPMLVHDVNEDGLADLIIGHAHGYGLCWYEQKLDAGNKRSFVRHDIETGYGGFHTAALGDLDGDGRQDLVTGKRLFPHHGRDVGEFDPLFVFWYEVAGGRFVRHPMAFNHIPWYPGRDAVSPPPNYAIGVGMKLNVADIDGNGRQDVVCAGKGGLYVFFNMGVTPSPRGKNLLPLETTYPSWVEWDRSAQQPPLNR